MRLSLKESRMNSLNVIGLDRKSGIRGPNMIFFYRFQPRVQSNGRASPHLFRPTSAGANMGHPYRVVADVASVCEVTVGTGDDIGDQQTTNRRDSASA
jgi:hypothetical protein